MKDKGSSVSKDISGTRGASSTSTVRMAYNPGTTGENTKEGERPSQGPVKEKKGKKTVFFVSVALIWRLSNI